MGAVGSSGGGVGLAVGIPDADGGVSSTVVGNGDGALSFCPCTATPIEED
jgi:hypothetical protein